MQAGVFVKDFEVGRVPARCVVTGRPTTHLVRLRSPAPARRRVAGLVPMERAVRRRALARAWVGFATTGLLAGAVLLGPVVGPDPMMDVRVLVAAAVLLAWLLLDRFRRVTVSLDRSRRWVTINHAHPRFVQAVRDAGLDPDAWRS